MSSCLRDLFLGFSGPERKNGIYSWLPFCGHTHSVPARLPACFVLLSTHKLTRSSDQTNAPFPGFATSFQWNPSSHMAELPVQPPYIVLHLGWWLVLFQLPLNKWGFNFPFISFERKTISMPFHSSVVCACPDFTLAGSHQPCPTTQWASCMFKSARPDWGELFLWFYCTFGLDWWAILGQNGQSEILPLLLICDNLKHWSVHVSSQTLNRNTFISD